VGKIAEHRVWAGKSRCGDLAHAGRRRVRPVGKIAIIVVASTTVGVSDFTHPTSLVGLSCRWHWDWPRSNFHRYVKNALLPADWGGDLAEIEGRFGE